VILDRIGNGCRLEPAGAFGVGDGPHACLQALDRDRPAVKQPVLNIEARAPKLRNPTFDRYVVAVARRQDEARADIDHGDSGEAIFTGHLDLLKAGCFFEQRHRRIVEILKVTWEIDDAGGVAVTPFNSHTTPVD
jgi:hypothetical protein